MSLGPLLILNSSLQGESESCTKRAKDAQAKLVQSSAQVNGYNLLSGKRARPEIGCVML